jgi:hypothetical protein
MKFTYHIKICAALWAILGAVCLAAAPASAAEPSWWTEQKRTCGLPSNLAYNNWDGKCNSSGGSTSAPSYDDGAAQRAQSAAAAAAAQRQADADRIERLAEEKRKKDAEFIRNRDAAARTLKGSSGAAMNQLKGLSGTDSFGLKGSGFDTGTGLKGLRGSDPVAPETTAASLNGGISGEGRNAGSGSKETCIPSQDPSVVDLCFLGSRSAAIDPWILKGMNPAEREALKASAKNMTEDLLPFDKEIYQAVADMDADPAKTGKQWPGPKNQGSRYLNPLSEPEKVKAYWDAFNAALHAHAEAEAKIVTAARTGSDWRVLRARQDADPKFRQSIEQISRNQENAEGLAQYQTVKKLREFLEKQGGADWADRVKNDKLFAARVVMERDALLKKMDQEISGARAKALKQMTVLVSGWKEK